MKHSYFSNCRSDAEVIEVLTAISIVSGRLAKNMSLLAVQKRMEKGGKSDGQNERNGRNH